MMGLMESIFDIVYLVVVTGLGIRLLLNENKNAKTFGLMAVLLGLGDGFHLLPRVMAHMSADGFNRFATALSWGKFVTGITMTIFYVLFYYYYRNISADKDQVKRWIIVGLAALRIILVSLPQNNWGGAESYSMGIIRNIPFLIMGILLIIWTYKNRKVEGLEGMSLYIALSFLFYIPVVLWSKTVPALGALMMPKTIAYVMIVVKGFRHFIKDFNEKNIFDTSLVYMFMGLAGGVFYREFTKYFSYTGDNHLGKLHVHTLVLGFIVVMVIFILTRFMKDRRVYGIKRPLTIYNIGLITTVSMMTVYGIYDVIGTKGVVSVPAMAGISGLGHIILTVGLVWMVLNIKKGIFAKDPAKGSGLDFI